MSESNLPRPEYPRPQLRRGDWINLNGPWTFTFDFGRSGVERGFAKSAGFEREIVVPFCPESTLSRIGYTDYADSIWYQRPISVPESWSGKRILLHFGAVDYESHVYVDGHPIYVHYGGSSSFTCDLTNRVSAGTRHSLVVHVKDDIRSSTQPGGKQSLEYFSMGCFYTRVSGIWQTVWMEAVATAGICRLDLIPNIDHRTLTVIPDFHCFPSKAQVAFRVRSANGILHESQHIAAAGLPLPLHIEEDLKMWHPEAPHLYDLELEVVSEAGNVIDSVQSYFGMRKIHVAGNQLYLNNEPLYLRMVLDQGFYPDGVWTAPTDIALKNDILLGKEAGFNGARLHQKVFEERYHYWADTLGYLTWGEAPSWGLDVKSDVAARNFLCEWREIVQRDKNHPSLIAWTPLNETWDVSNRLKHHRLHRDVYELTRSLDPSRPVNGASGGCQVVTDLYTVHIYEQDPSTLRQLLTPLSDGSLYSTLGNKEVRYGGQPYIVDEFGGIKCERTVKTVDEAAVSTGPAEVGGSWGYGVPAADADEFYTRLEGQVDAIVSQPHIAGYCYTQLTDVEQEQNGLYGYDRSLKFNPDRIRHIFSKLPSSSILPEAE